MSQKDYTAKDFATEAEYIKIKKIMDQLNMVYIPGEDNRNSQAVISQKTGLHNGDVITLSLNPKAKYDLGDMPVNLEPFEYRVTELTEGKDIDLFSDDAVIFYGLDGTDIVGAYSIAETSSLPEEIGEYIMYTAELSDRKETNLRENGTVIKVKAAMDQSFLDKQDYHNLDIYMKKHGYSYLSETETTLDLVLKPFEFDAVLRSETEAALAEYFYGKTAATYSETYVIDSVGNIQQLMNAKGAKRFEYIVTLHSTSEKGNEQALQSTVTILDLAGRIVISGATEPLYTEMSKLTEPINATYAVMAQFFHDN